MSVSIPRAGKLLLDSNCVIDIIGDFPLREEIFARNTIVIPAPVLGELYFGAYNSVRVETNLRRLHNFLRSVDVLAADRVTADWYGKIRFQLKQIGRPIPDNDIWIAAIALQHELTLATKDRHFGYIEGLEITIW